MHQASIKVEGLTCSGCALSIEKSIRNIKEVEDVKVSLDESIVHIKYRSVKGRNVLRDIAASISKIGYKVVSEKLTIFTEPQNAPDLIKKIEQIDGVISVKAFIDEIEISYISWKPEYIVEQVEKCGLRVLRFFSEEKEPILYDRELMNLRRDLIISAPSTLYFVINMFFHMELKYLDFLVCSIIMPIAYRRFGKGFIRKIATFTSDMNVLVTLGVFSAYIFSLIETLLPNFLPGDLLFYESSAVITFVILLGRYMESMARKETHSSFKKLLEMEPHKAHLIKDGIETEVNVSDLKQGDIVIIKEGERVPADGRLLKGKVKVDESHISGELQPSIKVEEDVLFCGAVVLEGWGLLKVESTGEQTVLRRMIKTIKESRFRKTRSERLADSISAVFVPLVLMISFFTFVIWLFAGSDFAFAFERAISVLVVACPCALGLATPTAIVVAVGKSAELGIVVKNPEIFEDLQRSKNVIFDKTGTLTEGKMKVKDIVMITNYDREEFLKLVASAESISEHKIAQAIVEHARKMNCNITTPDLYFSIKGKGIWAKFGEKEVIIGNEKIAKDFGLKISSDIQRETSDGLTKVFVFIEKRLVGVVLIEDKVREKSADVIEFLKKRNLNVFMMTGDSYESAEKIGKIVGISNIFAEVLPDQKVKLIHDIKAESEGGFKGGHKKVVMVGDGVNDAPALSSADIGIAVNPTSEITKASADAVVPSIELVPKLFELSDRVTKVIKWNLLWAFLYNILLIPIAAGVLYRFFLLLNPMLSALAMSISSIVVILNSLRIKAQNR